MYVFFFNLTLIKGVNILGEPPQLVSFWADERHLFVVAITVSFSRLVFDYGLLS